MRKLNWLLLLSIPLLLFSCKKDKTKVATEAGTVNFKVNNVVGTLPLELNGTTYLNAHGDSFTVTRYAYYLSNFEFVDENNKSYKAPETYFLIDEGDDASKSFSIADIPAGKYTKVRMLLGVDSAKNMGGAQTGVLDPLVGMYWDWNTGYIMAKFEGFSPQSGAPTNLLSFHLGGFGGPYSVLKTVEFDLPQAMVVEKGKTPTVKLESDVQKWFAGTPALDFSTTFSIMSLGREASDFAENYKNHLSVKAVEN